MPKFRKVTTYEVGQRDEMGRYSSDKIYLQNPSFFEILELLNEGPCRVLFNRVYSKRAGIRAMLCVRPYSEPLNAFDPRHPDLIAVIDLDLGSWRSMKYGEIIVLERSKQKELTYAQRKLVSKIRGQNWDYLWPEDEGESLQPDPFHQNERRFP
jgi:hypothetical protein